MTRPLAKLSQRERRLALLTIIILLGVVGYTVVTIARNRLHELDQDIEQAENELYQLNLQAKRLSEVDKAYTAVTEQHSSEWTQAEIHDRLRTELLRLALVNMPPPGSLPSAFSGEHLVEIPSWPAGSLDDRGEGYREYHIRITTKPTSIKNIALFLQRIHESPQILRVERLELVRPSPEAADVVLTMTVTRTIIGDTPKKPDAISPVGPTENLARNAGFEEWDETTGSFPEWEFENVIPMRLDAGASEGSWRLQATCQGTTGSISQIHQLQPKTTYDWEADIAANGIAKLNVIYNEKQPLSPEPIQIEKDGRVRKYRIRFTTPDTPQSQIEVHVPAISLESENGQLYMDNVVLYKVAS
jgi:hypothetical protein